MKHRTVRTLLHTCVRLTIGLGMLIALALSLVVPPAEAATRTFVGFDVTADGQGYLMMSSAGEFYAYGTARAWPNPTGFSGSMTSVAITADGQGALAMSSAGQFYAYGTVPPRSNPTGFTGGMVAVALTRDGQGMASLSGSGQVYAYGTVVWRGNGDPGTGGGTSGYAFIVPRNLVTLSQLGAKHHDYPASDLPVGTGTPYYAVIGGKISYTGNDGACGLGIMLSGDDGVLYTYCHGSERLVANGSRVTAGQLLGKTGNTGTTSTGPHLHFQIKYPSSTLRCPQTFLQAIYSAQVPPSPKTLPTTGCYY